MPWCELCNHSFGSQEALDQHLRDSPAHALSYECELCNRSFGSQKALDQHLRDSPAHSQLPKTPLNRFSNHLTALHLILIYHWMNCIRPYKDSVVGVETMRTTPELGTSTRKRLLKGSSSGLGQRMTLLLRIHFVALWGLNLYQEAVLNSSTMPSSFYKTTTRWHEFSGHAKNIRKHCWFD